MMLLYNTFFLLINAVGTRDTYEVDDYSKLQSPHSFMGTFTLVAKLSIIMSTNEWYYNDLVFLSVTGLNLESLYIIDNEVL